MEKENDKTTQFRETVQELLKQNNNYNEFQEPEQHSSPSIEITHDLEDASSPQMYNSHSQVRTLNSQMWENENSNETIPPEQLNGQSFINENLNFSFENQILHKSLSQEDLKSLR